MKYFDYAATTPIDDEALKAYETVSKITYGNTSSLHDIGSKAEHLLQVCRRELAEQLGVPDAGIYFTSGGTESNLLTIISLAQTNAHKGKHIITSMGEHASVDAAMNFLEKNGFTITRIPFTTEGIVDLSMLKQALRKDTILISIQHVNPEIGTIQPLEDISSLIADRGIVLHSDCIQSFGKIDVKPITRIVDSITVSSHKLYGPKGVGAAYIDPSLLIKPVFPGFQHEKGFRGGTVNVPGISGFITAASKMITNTSKQNDYQQFRDVFMQRIDKYRDHFTIYPLTHTNAQLPQIIGLGIKGMEGQLTMLECNRRGFAISTGSACQVGQQNPSKAMLAMDVCKDRAREFIRISFGKETVLEDVIGLANMLIELQQANDRSVHPVTKAVEYDTL